jgi:branched-chain amino acid transport system substrate-binding protein
MKSLLDSVEMAKSTEPGAIVQALESWKFKRGDIDVGYRAFDHQMTSRLLVAGIHPQITDKWDYFDVKAELPKSPEDIAKAFGSEADSACKMDTL